MLTHDQMLSACQNLCSREGSRQSPDELRYYVAEVRQPAGFRLHSPLQNRIPDGLPGYLQYGSSGLLLHEVFGHLDGGYDLTGEVRSWGVEAALAGDTPLKAFEAFLAEAPDVWGDAWDSGTSVSPMEEEGIEPWMHLPHPIDLVVAGGFRKEDLGLEPNSLRLASRVGRSPGTLLPWDTFLDRLNSYAAWAKRRKFAAVPSGFISWLERHRASIYRDIVEGYLLGIDFRDKLGTRQSNPRSVFRTYFDWAISYDCRKEPQNVWSVFSHLVDLDCPLYLVFGFKGGSAPEISTGLILASDVELRYRPEEDPRDPHYFSRITLSPSMAPWIGGHDKEVQ